MQIDPELLEDVKAVAIYCQRYDSEKLKDFEAKMERVNAPVSILQAWNHARTKYLAGIKPSKKSQMLSDKKLPLSNGKFEEWLEARMAEKIDQRLESHQNPNFC